MNRTRRPPPDLADSLANFTSNAVADIREKLVEEAWFGRSLGRNDRPSFDDMVRAVYGAEEPRRTEHQSLEKSRDFQPDF